MKKQHRTAKESYGIRTHLIHGNHEGRHWDFDHSNSVAYACGHPQMVANVKEILARARFHKDQIKEEKFSSLDAIDQ